MEKGLEKPTNDMADLAIEDAGDASDRKLLIAVDFGTTFSGVAWAQTRRVRSDMCSGRECNAENSVARRTNDYNPMARNGQWWARGC